MTAALRTLEVVGIWAIALAALNACRTSPRPKDESPIPAASHPRGDSDLASSGRLLVRLDGVPICSLALEGETVYFVTPDDTEPSGDTRNALWSVSTRGGPPVRRFSDRAFGSAPTLAGEFAYFLGRNGALRRARV